MFCCSPVLSGIVCKSQVSKMVVGVGNKCDWLLERGEVSPPTFHLSSLVVRALIQKMRSRLYGHPPPGPSDWRFKPTRRQYQEPLAQLMLKLVHWLGANKLEILMFCDIIRWALCWNGGSPLFFFSAPSMAEEIQVLHFFYFYFFFIQWLLNVTKAERMLVQEWVVVYVAPLEMFIIETM